MTHAEAAAFLRGLERRERSEWERVRMLMKGLGHRLTFPWDNEHAEAEEIDMDEVNRLRERAKKIKL